MQQLLKDVPATSADVFSRTLHTEKYRTFSVQMVTTPTSGGNAAASGWLQGSNNQTDWINISKLETTNATKTDGGTFQTIWMYMRFRLENSNGEKVNVYLAHGV